MDAIEQAVRNAFAKGNPEDPAYRERVYRSAQNALEKAIAANPNIATDAVARRRQKLLEVVASIESEFVQAIEPVEEPDIVDDPPPVYAPPPPAPSVSVEPPRVEAAPPRFDPPSQAEPSPRLEARREPDFSASREPPVRPQIAEPLAGSPRQDAAPIKERKPRRFPWGAIAGLTIFVVIVGLAVWTAVELGFVKLSGSTQGAQPSPTVQAGAEHEPGTAEANARLEDWMPVFSPSDPTTAIAANGARAEVAEVAGEQVIRISSGPSAAPIRFEIGQGVLERLAGKRAVFDIVARAGEGNQTQMSVTCSLQGLKVCGRNRYAVGAERAEYLFEVDVPGGATDGAGAIEIVSDVSKRGRSVELIEIRVTTAEPPVTN